MRYVFIVGCPRSGTTWLQMLLAQHPAVATSQETQLFNSYLTALSRVWKEHERTARGVGLKAILSVEEFDDLCRDFAHQVLGRIAEKNPKASVVLEKTPAHVRAAPLILKLLPDAYFIHIVRDPRSVVASLCAAASSWGHRWASTDPAANAKRWYADVSSGQKIADLTQQFQQLQYDDLMSSDSVEKLQQIFTKLDLQADPEFCRRALEACSIERLRAKSSDVKASNDLKASEVITGDPEDFYRKGEINGWQEDLSKRDVAIIEYIVAAKMQEFGYKPATFSTASGPRKPFRLILLDIANDIEWRFKRVIALFFAIIRRIIWV